MYQTFAEATGSLCQLGFLLQATENSDGSNHKGICCFTWLKLWEWWAVGLACSPGSHHHLGLVSLWFPQFCLPLGECFIPRLAAQVVCHQFQGQLPSSTASLSSDCRTNAFLGHQFSLNQSVWWGWCILWLARPGMCTHPRTSHRGQGGGA